MRHLLILFALLLGSMAHAQSAAIGVAPTRVVIAPNQNTSEIAVINNSDRLMRYKIEMADQMMTTSGTLQTISDTATFPYSAKNMVKFLPRTVNMPAGKRQTVRLLVTRPQGLPAGDYHTHLILTEIVDPVSATEVSITTPLKENAANFQVGMSYSMGIPLVVQQGTISSSISIVSASKTVNAQDKSPELTVTLQRSGNAEASGQLTTTINAAGKSIPATQNRIIRIYREADQVTIHLPILEEAVKAATTQPITLKLESTARKQTLQTLQIP